jgi:hypothetical protein
MQIENLDSVSLLALPRSTWLRSTLLKFCSTPLEDAVQAMNLAGIGHWHKISEAIATVG